MSFAGIQSDVWRRFLDDQFARVLEGEHSGVLENERTVIVAQ
jgi:hypothetical protein